jgi:undecaprenyl-diphosphatase
MLETLESIDRDLLLFLNGLHQDWLDPIMELVTGKWIWVPLYAFILFMTYRKFGIKGWGLAILLSYAVMLGMNDLGSVHLFKRVFMRFRPCHNLEIQNLLYLLPGHCSGKYGLISSHAANTFGLAMYVSLLFRTKWVWWAMFAWAAVVSYSRIYLGVHYPSDIVAGALWGMACSTFLFFLVRKFFITRL